MGYLFMAIALFAGCVKGYCGKKISGDVVTVKGTFFIMMIRMLICSVIGFLIAMAGGGANLKADLYTLLISAASGISTAMFVVVWIFCVRKGAYVMLDVFLMMGVGVTIGLCRVFFNEAASTNQLIGLGLLVIASVVMCSYSSNIKGSFTLGNFLLLAVCGIFNGLADFSQKWFVYSFPDGSIAVFNFYTYVFAAIVLLISFIIGNKTENAENDGKNLKTIVVICIMAACLFAYSYFKTMAAKYIPSGILYPLCSGAALVLSAIMASVFFKEKITVKCICGMVIATAALIVMNI